MSLTDYVVMPGEDYQAICDAIREKTETTEPIKSGDAAGMIQGIQGGGASGDYEALIKALCEQADYSLSGEGAEVIARRAFDSEVNLRSVNFSKTQEVMYDAFRSSGLRSVSLPSVGILYGGAFSSCQFLEIASLPKVITMDHNAFSGCTSLQSVFAPELVEIGSMAFALCTAFEHITMPSLRNIGESAFEECTNLVSAIFPDARSVDTAAFNGCSALKKIDFGSVVSLGTGVFYQCNALEAVIFRTTAGVCVATPGSMEGSPLVTGGAFVYVPAVMWDYYSAAYSAGLEDAMGIPGAFNMLFRKIEDYPEICG